MEPLDAVVFLNNEIERSYEGGFVLLGNVQVEEEVIIYGLIIFEKIWLTKGKITEKDFDMISDNPLAYGIDQIECDEYDIPNMFRKNQHENGQSKLLCNALEVMTVVAESDMEEVNMCVEGSSSQNINAGSAYHVSAYILSLMNLKKASLHLYDFFETSHVFRIGNVSVKSFTHPNEHKREYNVVIDDTWLPGKTEWKPPTAGIWSVKNFELLPEYLQPFFEAGVMRETRKSSYKWDYSYKGSCFFEKRPCYECSYVYNLVNRLIQALRKRDSSNTYLEKLRPVLYSWIYKYRHRRKDKFLKFEYHSAMLNTYIAAYKLRDFNIHDATVHGLSDTVQKMARKFFSLPSKLYDRFGPENRLYSMVQYSVSDERVRFMSKDIRRSYIDKHLKDMGNFKYLILSRKHITPSKYVKDHLAVIEYDEGNDIYFKAYRQMVREKPSRIFFFSREEFDLPLDMFSRRKKYEFDGFVYYVTVCSNFPHFVYEDFEIENNNLTCDQFREKMQIIGVKVGSVEYKRFLRFLNLRYDKNVLVRGSLTDVEYATFLMSVYKSKEEKLGDIRVLSDI
jgi:hypothetical protein